ncbi:MAG TPA: FAD-dependent oxidoreductase [Patescibacteria group bacterium]|nr:FAD-dependent oxidoreductase [Patescibacteria group bacterium]
MDVTLSRFEALGSGAITLWFKPEHPLRYDAGQFTQIYLPHEADDRGQHRWFTLSSAPTEPELAITTRFAASKGSTFKQRLLALKPGDTLKLADPMGDFVLPKDTSTPLVLVAAGMGITPVRSMIKYLHDRGERRTINIIYAISKPEDAMFTDLLREYGASVVVFVTEQTGPLTAPWILKLAGYREQALYYLSGPEALVEKLSVGLQDVGVDKQHIVADLFPGYANL